MKLEEFVDSLKREGWVPFYQSSGKDRAWLRLTASEVTVETMVRTRLLSKNFAVNTLNHFVKKITMKLH